MSIEEITAHINCEDKAVPIAVERALPQLNDLIKAIVSKLKGGGRLFYLGAGSGGRLAVLDAIELPTTFGISKGIVNVILAGGVDRLIDALEDREDSVVEGWQRLVEENVSSADFVLGISASGSTPFVLAALKKCQSQNIQTGCLVGNSGSPIVEFSDFPVEVVTGPEFLTGSTRMKCGTAQKIILDMISTATMIQLGRVEDNRMVNVKLINEKLIDRGVKMLMERSGITNYDEAKQTLLRHGTVKKALDLAVNK